MQPTDLRPPAGAPEAKPAEGQKPALSDRYSKPVGRILVSGTQALIRLMIEQAAADKAAGLHTAGYVSGYRGSPLAGFDTEMARARPFLAGAEVVFQPGLNEDLAATAVWGSQQTDLSPGARHDGVFAMWYGKGPGVDRSMDAIRHANAAGTHPRGGVLLLMGDDHGAVSSTLPHQSEHNLISAMVPILSPAGVEDYIPFGLAGFAMSRFSGAWVGFKCQTEIVECSATVELPARRDFTLPDIALPTDGVSIRWPDNQLAQEKRLEIKLRAAQGFAVANNLDVISGARSGAKRGIVATGKGWRDLTGALARLGVDAHAIGLRLYKVGLIWPLVPETLEAFAEGLDEILIVEEKRPVIEDQIRVQFYGRSTAPRLFGKSTPKGAPLISATAELDPLGLAEVVARFLDLPAPETAASELPVSEPMPFREPYFCSGCPHSVSTRLPEGSRATAGIGCSMLAVGMDRHVETFTQMGGEGANWIGHAPFTDERHLFVHMGDGTYFHSGLLAIRAAVAAKVNATYKILFNDAVAMTGGQKHDGELSVPAIVDQLRAEGLREVVVISETPEVWTSLPVKVLGRDALMGEQERLRQMDGITAIIYDQVCAAEKRRRRKRGSFPQMDERVVIHPEVCEGCGDCSVQSNCISVEPLDTPLGLKRQINQSACNGDRSCLKGFCPSFITLPGAVPRKTSRPLPEALKDELPEPAITLDSPRAILMTGIGGTGVITVSAILTQAAYLDGLAVLTLDQTGLAQKNGAVMSHLRLARQASDLHAPRIGTGEADLLLGFDKVVAVSPKAIRTLDAARSRAVVDSHFTPTASFVKNPSGDLKTALPMANLRKQLAAGSLFPLDATELAETYFGDAIASNILLTGFAWQSGLIPISRASIEAAIALNGGGAAQNLQAFQIGRLAAVKPDAVIRKPVTKDLSVSELKAMLARRLELYQNRRYARRFLKLIEKAERRVADWPGAEAFLVALMRGCHHVMAYKDEYEVARLLSDESFLQSLGDRFEGDLRPTFHLAPPLLSKTDARTGRPMKRRFGPNTLPAFRLLRRLKGLRGTPFDPFGYHPERKAERALREDYLGTMSALIESLQQVDLNEATRRAGSVLFVKGYGPVKALGLEQMREAFSQG
ncbi:indolepyruvate ferredoxin oxidoreductase family protein, partial [Paracoccus aminophilus]